MVLEHSIYVKTVWRIALTIKQGHGKKQRGNEVRRCAIGRIDIGNGQSYCIPCYRTQKVNNPKENSKVRRNNCFNTRLGCKGCNEQFCDTCWKSYDHNPLSCSKL